MIKVLAVMLVLLLYMIGGSRGIITFKSLCFNIAVLSISIILMSYGWDPVIVTFISCLVICYITLFYQNGKNSKTIASFCSVILVLLVLFSLSYYVGYKAHLGGVNEIIRYEDEIAMLSPDININMSKIAVSMIITGLIGAAMDASIAVSSAVYEVYKNNRLLSLMELFKSGIHIGSDILGATVNTLYFACLGESLALFVLLKTYHYSILEVINSKAFCQEFVDIIVSCISCTLVIPLTAIAISYILKNLNKFERYLLDDELFIEMNS
ncbi:YibE/F family protein [Clostridium aminobutyricum]|uniref:YibE/F family protein n=1 Tax=Clostridium aminobutyricum TaxID=33953 RepID=A0A939D629_CLOAM|nr:YibE/F family protein [Clostridium aminobutyricum]MBN7772179.1 YibE/F family protein [Clostridium aminobutyricum]